MNQLLLFSIERKVGHRSRWSNLVMHGRVGPAAHVRQPAASVGSVHFHCMHVGLSRKQMWAGPTCRCVFLNPCVGQCGLSRVDLFWLRVNADWFRLICIGCGLGISNPFQNGLNIG